MSESKKNSCLSIAIMSGKGGVGKSNLALNLGYALAKSDFSTLLMDCDLGLANLDVLLGISPEHNLQDVIAGTQSANDVIVPIVEEGSKKLSLLPSASGIPELADLPYEKQVEMLSTLSPVFDDYKMLLLDLGAGVHENVQYFAAMAAIRLIILTPEPTSLTDAYALVKVLKTKLNVNEFLVIVNQAESLKEAQAVFDRLATACEHFIKVKPFYLGAVSYDTKLQEAVIRQTPCMHLFPDTQASKDLNSIALKLTKIYASMVKKIADKEVLQLAENNEENLDKNIVAEL